LEIFEENNLQIIFELLFTTSEEIFLGYWEARKISYSRAYTFKFIILNEKMLVIFAKYNTLFDKI
jgi:hypothetical protein